MVLPVGTATSTVQQAEQLVASAHQSLSADEQALQSTGAANAESLSEAEQAVSADEASLALANTSELQGMTQAEQPVGADNTSLRSTRTGNSQALAQAEQAVSQDQAALKTAQTSNSQALAQAEQAVSQDQAALKTAETSNSQALAQVEQAVSQDQAALKTAQTSNSQALAQAEQAVSQDQAALKTAQTSNSQALAQVEQAVSQDQAALASGTTSNSQALAQAEQAASQAKAALKTTEISNAQSLGQAEQQLQVATSALGADQAQLTSDEARLSADQQKEAADCAAGGSAAPSGGGSSASACSTDEAQVAQDQAAVTSDKQKTTSDNDTVQTGQTTIAATKTNNEKSLQQAQGQLAAAQQTVAATKTNNQKSVQQAQAQLTARPTNGCSHPETNNDKAVQQAQAQLAAAQATVAATKTNNDRTVQQAQAQTAAAQATTVAATQTNSTTRRCSRPRPRWRQPRRPPSQPPRPTTTRRQRSRPEQLAAAEATVAATKNQQPEVGRAAGRGAVAGGARERGGGPRPATQSRCSKPRLQLSGAHGGSVTATRTNNQKSAQQAEAEVEARLGSTLSQDESALANDRADAAVGTAGGVGSPTYTDLPEVGQVIGRGQELFAIDGQPSILLYGDVTPWRAFMPGMAPGPDVLRPQRQPWTPLAVLATAARGCAPSREPRRRRCGKFQAAHHMTPTGQLALGSVLFDPGQIEVNSVTPTMGSTPSPGQAVLQVTLTARQVQIALDASQQSEVAVGDQVSIVMPNNSTTPGVVSYVGTVATTPSSQNGGSGSPTIEVNVTPLDPAATGNLDDLPVNVWITQSTVPNAFVVQVDALTALAGGGYALEVAPSHGAHYLEAVTVGQFDDADGMVQVSGSGVHVGQRVVVPNV